MSNEFTGPNEDMIKIVETFSKERERLLKIQDSGNGSPQIEDELALLEREFQGKLAKYFQEYYNT